MMTNSYKGQSRQFRFTAFDATTTLSIWTPTTSTKVAFDGLTISNNAAAGTFLITWGNLAGSKIFEFTVGTSASIFPVFGTIEGTMYDRSLFGRPSSSPTNGWSVTVTGFEID